MGNKRKWIEKNGKNKAVKLKTVIYDPKLTVTLPAEMTVTSGMNAIAHCVEVLYAENANPVTTLLAEEGIRVLYESLPEILAEPTNVHARSKALYGTWLGGTVLGSVGMALHHKICHILGGSYNLPHGPTHTVILPYALSYNASYAQVAVKAIAREIHCEEDDVAGTIFDFLNS